ncbi:hypothetical protein ABMA27_010338 [Loxostege sticticalis]|uniref:Peptidase A2 domain-containing protein n=1 Tax=Loxostege sticticalis TaxID=481309 RepID=A0ABR3H5E4_LOXSC
MSPEDKMRSISQLHICRNCLYSHNDNKCNSTKRCRVCKDAHHTTLHDIYRKVEIAVSNNVIPNNKPHTSQQKANHVSGNYNEVLLATVQLKVMAADGSTVQLRCLLDQGSQINLITEHAAQRLGLQRQNRNATVSGIGTSAHHSNGTVRLDCESLYGGHTFTIEAMVMANMLSNLPNYTFEKQDWPHIQNIQLADQPVDILLDAGVYADIVMSGMLRGPTHAPMAQQTKVGWVLLGNIKTFNCHVLINLDDVSRFWEMEEITEANRNLTAEEEYCESFYSTTTSRQEDGRYAVRLPMKTNYEPTLGTSKPQAVAQFRQLEKRLAKQETFSTSYKNFIDEYLQLGHMKPCTEHHEPSYFLPHHGVQKLDSTTTKLRVVFNASAKTSTGKSLNDLMECGPNLQQDLQSMILRWRAFQYVYTADIEKFYRQVLIHEEDQHLQKIVWRDSAQDLIKEYQLCTVTYGTKAAPFLAMRTIIQLVMDDGHRYPLAAEILTHQLYVDDLLGGSNDILEAQDAQHQLIDMLKGGGFNLRKWASNHPILLQTLPEHLISQNMFDFKDAESNKTLGLTWNPHTDQFTFKAPLSNTHDVTTKRTLLSDLSKLYDPLGWLSPVTMKAKLIFQQAWTASTDWDEPLPEDIQQEWSTFQQELPTINNIALQRWIGDTKQPIELHGFSDASEKAYGCVIYCKSFDAEGQQIIKLVAGKTKLAPLRKPPSLPRLELCGALLLSRLMKKVIESINSQTITIHGWTDSMIVMGWLQGGPSRWTTFVANRVTQITDIMPSGCWTHVKSEHNAADCASRGLTPLQLANHHLWWGPIWLKDSDLPLQETFHTNAEEKKVKQVCVSQRSMPLIEELLRPRRGRPGTSRHTENQNK